MQFSNSSATFKHEKNNIGLTELVLVKVHQIRNLLVSRPSLSLKRETWSFTLWPDFSKDSAHRKHSFFIISPVCLQAVFSPS